jgi:16S rRNA U516 pseudouridylate synthase RsuA-like enzyme
MFAYIGHPVLALAREAFGPLELGHLEPGSFRPLTDKELEELRQST